MQAVLVNNYEIEEPLTRVAENRKWPSPWPSQTRARGLRRETLSARKDTPGSWLEITFQDCRSLEIADEYLIQAICIIGSTTEQSGVDPFLHAAFEKFKKYQSANVDIEPAVSREDRDLFRRDLDLWRSDTRFSSNLSAKLSHPAYLRIIALGRKALPLIFEDLRDGGGHWFVALRAITREDPVPPEHRSLPHLMREDWLRWGATKGYTNDQVALRSKSHYPDRTEIPATES